MEDREIRDSQKNSYYELEDRTTADYMLEELGKDVVVPKHNDINPNPFVIRHALTQDMDVTTALMWMQAFAPVVAGALVGSGLMSSIGLGFVNKYILVILLDAIIGIADVFVLFKHEYDVMGLIFWSVWLPPVYMKKRMNLLNEVNYQHIVWIITIIMLIII